MKIDSFFGEFEEKFDRRRWRCRATRQSVVLCIGVYSSDKREYSVEEAQIFDIVDRILKTEIEKRRIFFEKCEQECIQAMK